MENATIKPLTSINGEYLLLDVEPCIIIGISGKTQGDKIISIPAKKLNKKYILHTFHN